MTLQRDLKKNLPRDKLSFSRSQNPYLFELEALVKPIIYPNMK